MIGGVVEIPSFSPGKLAPAIDAHIACSEQNPSHWRCRQIQTLHPIINYHDFIAEDRFLEILLATDTTEPRLAGTLDRQKRQVAPVLTEGERQHCRARNNERGGSYRRHALFGNDSCAGLPIPVSRHTSRSVRSTARHLSRVRSRVTRRGGTLDRGSSLVRLGAPSAHHTSPALC